MKHMLNGDVNQEREFLLQDYEHAFSRALHLIALWGAHWTECARNSGKPCTCGFVLARRELARVAPRSAQ